MKVQFRRFSQLVVLALLIGAFGLSSVQAQSSKSFTLAPGGVATITFEAYCSQFGKFFPAAGVVVPTGIADAKLRSGLAYIQANGLSAAPATALEAQFGLWQVAGAQRVPAGGDTTKAVVAAAAAAPPADPQGVSVIDAAKANQVKLAITSWTPIGDKVQILSATDNFYARGTMTVENVSQETLTLFLPVGTIFPATEARFQTMAGYQTDVQAPRLPTTGAAEELPASLLVLVALALLTGGWLVVRRAMYPLPQ